MGELSRTSACAVCAVCGSELSSGRVACVECFGRLAKAVLTDPDPALSEIWHVRRCRAACEPYALVGPYVAQSPIEGSAFLHSLVALGFRDGDFPAEANLQWLESVVADGRTDDITRSAERHLFPDDDPEVVERAVDYLHRCA